jgi:hypothetical protein
MAKRASRRPSPPSTATSLSGLSLHALKAEIGHRQRRAKALSRRRARLLEKLDGVEAEIAKTGMNLHGTSGGGSRPRNHMSLVEALAGALKGEQMSVGEVTEAVQRAGYASTSPNFRVIVNAALLNKERFKRVERGVYTAK